MTSLPTSTVGRGERPLHARPNIFPNGPADKKGRSAASHHNPGPQHKGKFPMTLFTKIQPVGQPQAGTIHWLTSCIDRSRSGVFSEVVTVSPGLAAELLRRNEDNRGIKAVKATQYASDMRAGRWTFNGEPIIVSDTGLLNDGQHRLMALIDANICLPFVIVFGVPRESRETVDQGGARTASDYLAMSGTQNACIASTIARLVLAYEQSEGQHVETKQVTNGEVVARVRNDDGIANSAHYAATVGIKAQKYVAATVIGFCHYLMSEIDGDDAAEYLGQVCTGVGLKPGCAAIAVRERLLAEGKSRQRKIAIIFRGWNFHRRGMRVRTSSLPAAMPLPALV